jgi:mono/diheme cytochrome c family protein
MSYRLLLICLLLLIAFWIVAQPSSISAAPSVAVADDQANPVKPSPDNLAKAKKLFGYDCAMCHGENGDGKGDLAADFKTKPRDYTNPASLKEFSDQQLFTIIKDGKDEMPPEGKRAKPEDIWGLVAYLRTLSKS